MKEKMNTNEISNKNKKKEKDQAEELPKFQICLYQWNG